jgi:hypothetical protein
VKRALAACGLVACSSSAVAAHAAPVVVERILAVVDGRPVMLSEVRVYAQVTGQEPARALEALIDERLMFREAARLPQAAVGPDEEVRAVASLRARAGAAAAAVPEPELRQLARRQATILKYIDFRFGPQVRREAGDDAAAEEEGPRPGGDELRERIEAWVKELRQAAEVRYTGDPPAADARPGA